MTWKWFTASSILAAGLLLQVGAPIVAIVIGIFLAAAMTWANQHRR